MKSAGIALLEPIMRLEVVVPEDYLSIILKDLAKRRAEVKYIDVFKQNKVKIFLLLF